MRKKSYAPHYAISRYSIREFKTGAEPFMVAIIIIIIIIYRKIPLKDGMQRCLFLRSWPFSSQ